VGRPRPDIRSVCVCVCKCVSVCKCFDVCVCVCVCVCADLSSYYPILSLLLSPLLSAWIFSFFLYAFSSLLFYQPFLLSILLLFQISFPFQYFRMHSHTAVPHPRSYFKVGSASKQKRWIALHSNGTAITALGAKYPIH
jgi:hypothetical protein